MNYTLLDAETLLIGMLACIGLICVIGGAIGLFFLLKAWFAQERERRIRRLEKEQTYQRAQDSLIEFAEDLLKEK